MSLGDPMDYNPLGSSVHGILPKKKKTTLVWVVTEAIKNKCRGRLGMTSQKAIEGV